MRMSCVIASAAAVSAFAGSALAGPIATFGFTDLRGSYAGTLAGGTFRAEAEALPGLMTSGDVTRVIAPEGTADYFAGFFGGSTLGDYELVLTVSSIVVGPVSTALGSGTMVIRDHDGDRIEALVDGFFFKATGDVSFNGTLSSVAFITSGNGTFDGPSGGSFGMGFPGGPLYDGAIVELHADPSSFFGTSWDMVSVQVNGTIVPTPASLALLGLGGLVAGRRRR